MNLDEVNAILVWKDGEPHSFGDKKMFTPEQLSERNYHNFSFMQDVYSTEWFKDTGYNYEVNKNFTNQMESMAAHGFIILCNTSSRVSGHEDYYCYLIYVPEKITDNQREYLESIYDSLKENIDKHQALFQAVMVDENSNYCSQYMFYLDDFYDYLNLKKGKNMNK